MPMMKAAAPQCRRRDAPGRSISATGLPSVPQASGWNWLKLVNYPLNISLHIFTILYSLILFTFLYTYSKSLQVFPYLHNLYTSLQSYTIYTILYIPSLWISMNQLTVQHPWCQSNSTKTQTNLIESIRKQASFIEGTKLSHIKLLRRIFQFPTSPSTLQGRRRWTLWHADTIKLHGGPATKTPPSTILGCCGICWNMIGLTWNDLDLIWGGPRHMGCNSVWFNCNQLWFNYGSIMFKLYQVTSMFYMILNDSELIWVVNQEFQRPPAPRTSKPRQRHIQ